MKLYGLIGRKLGHSFSRKYFSKKFEQLGIDASYELFELDDISEFPSIKEKHPHILGLNVTIPYKQEVIPYMDELSPEAAAIGAVNTIKFHKDRISGHNSDIFGFGDTLQQFVGDTQLEGALILGTGGAAKAVAYVLENWMHIPNILWVSRNPTEADHISYHALNDLQMDQYPLIINTTPLGMYPAVDVAPDFPYHALGNQHYVYDLIYNPEKTLFLQKAAIAKARILNGMPMLIGQAEKSWEIWQK